MKSSTTYQHILTVKCLFCSFKAISNLVTASLCAIRVVCTCGCDSIFIMSMCDTVLLLFGKFVRMRGPLHVSESEHLAAGAAWKGKVSIKTT